MARNKIHAAVRKALEKDGWIVTNDPFIVNYGKERFEIDMAAGQVLVAEKGSK